MARFVVAYSFAKHYVNHTFQQSSVLDSWISTLFSQLDKLSKSTRQLCYHWWREDRGCFIRLQI